MFLRLSIIGGKRLVKLADKPFAIVGGKRLVKLTDKPLAIPSKICLGSRELATIDSKSNYKRLAVARIIFQLTAFGFQLTLIAGG